MYKIDELKKAGIKKIAISTLIIVFILFMVAFLISQIREVQPISLVEFFLLLHRHLNKGESKLKLRSRQFCFLFLLKQQSERELIREDGSQ